MIVTESPLYQDPTEIVGEKLADQGWDLETTYVTDIILPNQAVADGDYDVNFFQSQAFQRQANIDNGTGIETMFSVYYPPSGIFSVNHDSIEEIPDGGQIAIPVDTSQNGRALHLLGEAGLIEVNPDKEITELSQRDIIDNPKNIDFVEIDQQSMGQSLPDVDAVWAVTRFVIDAGYSHEETGLFYESGEEAHEHFTVGIAALPGFRDTEAAQVLQDAYHSDEVQEWYDNYLDGIGAQGAVHITLDNGEEFWTDYAE